MQPFDAFAGLSDQNFVPPSNQVISEDPNSAVRQRRKQTQNSASQDFGFAEPFHARNDSTSSLARAGQVDFAGQQGFEGIPIGSRETGIGVLSGEESSNFFGRGLRDAGALWTLNTSDLSRDEAGSSATSPVSTYVSLSQIYITCAIDLWAFIQDCYQR